MTHKAPRFKKGIPAWCVFKTHGANWLLYADTKSALGLDTKVID